MSQILETGKALDAFASRQAPQKDHQPAVGDRQISRKHGPPISCVLAQSRETRPGRCHDKTSTFKHQCDRFINIAVEEADTENLMSRRAADVRHGKSCHDAVAGSISSTAGK